LKVVINFYGIVQKLVEILAEVNKNKPITWRNLLFELKTLSKGGMEKWP